FASRLTRLMRRTKGIHMRIKAFGLSALVIAFGAVAASQASAQTSIGIVTQADLAGSPWTGQVFGDGRLRIVPDPPSDFFGGGSLQFAMKDNKDGAQVRFSDGFWTLKLSQISLTYRALSSGKQCKKDEPKKKETDHNRALILLFDVD